jgi:hypothetical protein
VSAVDQFPALCWSLGPITPPLLFFWGLDRSSSSEANENPSVPHGHGPSAQFLPIRVVYQHSAGNLTPQGEYALARTSGGLDSSIGWLVLVGRGRLPMACC